MSFKKYFERDRRIRIQKLLADIMNDVDELVGLVKELEFVTKKDMSSYKKDLVEIYRLADKLYRELSQ